MATDRTHLEKAWAAMTAYRSLTPDQVDLWETCRYVQRMLVYVGKELKVWSVFMGKPKILNTFYVEDAGFDFDTGLSLLLVDQAGKELRLSTKPVQVPDTEVFLWLPFFQDLQWTPNPATQEFGARMSLVLRAPSSPERELVEGCAYVTDAATLQRFI